MGGIDPGAEIDYPLPVNPDRTQLSGQRGQGFQDGQFSLVGMIFHTKSGGRYVTIVLFTFIRGKISGTGIPGGEIVIAETESTGYQSAGI